MVARRLAADGGGCSDDESAETTSLLLGSARPARPPARAAGGGVASYVGAMMLVLTLGVVTVVSLAGPVTEAVLGPRPNPERDAMLRAMKRVQESARGEAAYNEMHYHADTASPLPMMERLKRQYAAPGHDHHHVQTTYAPLHHDGGAAVASAEVGDPPKPNTQRRRSQDSGGGLLDISSTDQLEILLDTSSFYKATEADPTQSNPNAVPYSTCFEVGQWFQWNFPPGASPPCASPQHNGAPMQGSSVTHSQYAGGSQIPCGAGVGTLYDRVSKPTGNLCNRNQDNTEQNCWGVCVKEDVLNIDTIVQGDSDWITECSSQPELCNMRQWMEKELRTVVDEANGYFRARKKTGALRLARSKGIYNHIYTKYGIAAQDECARDAKLMYRLPVKDSYCDVSGLVDASGKQGDVIFFPLMSQYIPNVGGWGGDAGKDQFGRPLVLVMGCEPGVSIVYAVHFD
jgi:hypothetical protein